MTNGWKSATCSGSTNCVQVRCGNGACVEARSAGAIVQVRDSKDPSGPILSFDADAWSDFLGGMRNGDFDL
jgi:putative methionine-R-sulfoxide reductase with GAF domain